MEDDIEKQFGDEIPDLEKMRQEYSDELLQPRLDRDFSDKPPWQLRKTREIATAYAHADLNKDLALVGLCTQESVFAISVLLTEYFMSTYDLSQETSESLILLAATGDVNFILASKQIDGIRYFNHDEQIAGPSNDKQATYENLLTDIARKDPHVNIRIGRSATKEDVLWFIENYWESDISPTRGHGRETENVRAKPKMLRDRTIYALRREGWTYSRIQEYINLKYGEFIETTAIRKTYERLKPTYDWFDMAHEQVKELGQSILKGDVDVKLIFKKKPEPHFELESL